MAETKVYKGVLEDSTGAQMMPATTAEQVVCNDGTTAEAKMAGMLPKSGGTMAGDFGMFHSKINVDTWGSISAGTDGAFMIAQNAYKHSTANTYHFTNNHSSMGARGIIFRLGIKDVYYFDTGPIATTKDAAFTPNFVRLATGADSLQKTQITNDSGLTINISNRDLNMLTQNGFYSGENLANAPSTGVGIWYYVLVIGMNTSYSRQIAFDTFTYRMYTRAMVNGSWTSWVEMFTNVGGNINGTLGVIAEGGHGLQLVGSTHVYIPFFRQGTAAGRSAYLGYGDQNPNFTIHNEVAGGYIHLLASAGVTVNGNRIPTIFASTAAPTAAQGVDGDVWQQYI